MWRTTKQSSSIRWGFILVCLSAWPSLSRGAWPQEAKLLPEDAEAVDLFGSAVSISGDYAIVGAPSHDGLGDNAGAAYIFHWDGRNWTQTHKLEASDGGAGDRFGYSVSLDGGVALVGAPYADGNGPGSGAAYVFRLGKRHIPGQGFVVVWDQEAKLTAPDGKTDNEFGYAVSLEGDLALIGAPESESCGQSYVFRSDPGAWTLESTLTTSYPLEEFGCSADIHNGYAIFGAISYDGSWPNFDYYGHELLFRRVLRLPIGWVWEESSALVMGLGTYPSLLPVAITGGWVVAGDPTAPGYAYDGSYSDWMSAGNLGAVFTYQENTPVWNLVEVLAPGDRKENDCFGSSLAISGDYMAISIPGRDEGGTDIGAVYIYRQLAGVLGKTAVLLPSGGGEGDWFGAAVAIDLGHIIVGAPLNDGVRKEDCGAAYIFRVCPTADSDGDCQVNFLDFARFADQWLG